MISYWRLIIYKPFFDVDRNAKNLYIYTVNIKQSFHFEAGDLYSLYL
jgi:hypothetical protein